MFKENKRPSATATDTLIGQGTLSEGKILCEVNLRIEGEHRGDIECKGDVIIGEGGIARSNITARDITVAGKIFGDILTTGQLIITSSGHLTGNITAHKLIIQDGGMLNGNCHMEQTQDPKNRSLAESEHILSKDKDSNIKDSKEKSRQAG
jgi:cytoskeletal protein CcmA (bactofilin family)